MSHLFASNAAFEKNNIPVFYATDENYAPYLYVSIKSLISHISSEYNYDICILIENLSDRYKKLITSLAAPDNVSVRFFNIGSLLDAEREMITYTCCHFTVAMYYRLFIADIFTCYDKVVYLDCDTIILADIAELYQTDISAALLGGAYDFGAIQLDNGFIPREYISETLKVDYKKYINSGVLVMNTRQFRNLEIKIRCLQKLAEIKTPYAPDQDILNAVCRDRILFLPVKWNYEWSLPNSYKSYLNLIPVEYRKEFQQAAESPKIIHYTGDKPWKCPHLRYAEYFWQYARNTPVYEMIIFHNFPRPQQVQVLPDYALIREIISYGRNRLTYWRYKLMSKITWGRRRKKYKNKRKYLKSKLKLIKQYLK